MSLRIALLGYGKMGRAVEQEALARGHRISHRIDRENTAELEGLSPESSDIVIEFTEPATALPNFRKVLERGLSLVTGTTGWLDEMEAVKTLTQSNEGSFLYASNFSIGVNVLFQLNKRLSELMNGYSDYDPFVEERHHRYKKDAPSGTARTLAEDILAGLDRKTDTAGAELTNRAPEPHELSVGWTRAGEIIGTHEVSYTSEIDRISIRHEAYNRRGFALGAVIGAEWLHNKQGFYNFAQIFE